MYILHFFRWKEILSDVTIQETLVSRSPEILHYWPYHLVSVTIISRALYWDSRWVFFIWADLRSSDRWFCCSMKVHCPQYWATPKGNESSPNLIVKFRVVSLFAISMFGLSGLFCTWLHYGLVLHLLNTNLLGGQNTRYTCILVFLLRNRKQKHAKETCVLVCHLRDIK